jgi:hypothetical protein
MGFRRIGMAGPVAVLAVAGAIALAAESPWAAAAPGGRATAGTAAAVHEATARKSAGSRAAATGPRRVTFVNALKQTIWVAASPDKAHPLAATGWVLRPGHSVTITVPDHWNGRFWGRTGCVPARPGALPDG